MKAKEEEANSVLGDKMQQKIDSVVFNQSKMQKQMNDLQNKVQVINIFLLLSMINYTVQQQKF